MTRHEKILLIQDRIAMDPEMIPVAYEVFSPKLKSFIKKYVGEYSTGDVLQETFLRLTKYHHTFDKNIVKFSTWIYTVAMNAVRYWINMDQRHDRCEEIVLHLHGAETMSQYRRQACIDSSQDHHVRRMLARKYDTRLDRLDQAKWRIRNHPHQYPIMNYILDHRGDIEQTELANRLDVGVGVVHSAIKAERKMLETGIPQKPHGKRTILRYE